MINKVSFKIEKIEEVPGKNEITMLRIFIRSNGKLYEKSVKKSEYLDEQNRRSFHRLWIKSIKAAREEENPDPRKAKRDKKVLSSMIEQEIEDDGI